MAYFVTFKRDDEVLLRYEFEAQTPDDYSDLIAKAHEAFQEKYPDISLFDGITTIYDKD